MFELSTIGGGERGGGITGELEMRKGRLTGQGANVDLYSFF